MAIEAEVSVVLAEVEVTDEYTVGLKTHRRRTAYTPDEARQFATELVDAADLAERMYREDMAAHAEQMAVHGFDVDRSE